METKRYLPHIFQSVPADEFTDREVAAESGRLHSRRD